MFKRSWGIEGIEADRLSEQTEEGGSGSGHRGIDSSETVQVFLDGTNLRMKGENALLKVVGEFVAPGLHRLLHDVETVLRWVTGSDE